MNNNDNKNKEGKNKEDNTEFLSELPDWKLYTSTLNFVDDLIYISEVLRKYSDETVKAKVYNIIICIDVVEFY